MKKIVFAVLTGLALFATCALRAENGPLLVRVRGVYIDPADKSDANAAAHIPADAITVDTKTIPEVDFTYFFTKNFAAELILTYPQELDVYLAGDKIGSFKALPPTLTAQWHFLPDGPVDPYIGAGVNLTLISSVDLAGGTLDLEQQQRRRRGSARPRHQGRPEVGHQPRREVRPDQRRREGGRRTISTVHVDPWLLGGASATGSRSEARLWGS